MSQKDELINRLRSKPKDFTLREFEMLFILCGCRKSNAGRTSGSAIKFIYDHDGVKRTFSVHRPHPENTLKRYVLVKAIQFLTDVGAI